MTAATDPRAVREIARQAIRSLIDEQQTARRYSQRSHIELAMIEHGVNHSDLNVWPEVYGAVLAVLSQAQITVSWPDEQPQDERDVCGAWLDARQADVAHDHDRPGMTPDSCYCGLPKPCEQRADDMAAIEQLRAVLERRAELVVENARLWGELEAAQDERDGDVRVADPLRDVDARVVDNAIGLLKSQQRPGEPVEIYNAICLLVGQFGGRIEAMDVALDARDAKAGD